MFGWGPSVSDSEAGVTRRTFLSGVVVVGAAVGLAGVAEGALPGQKALAATPPSGPPTVTLPLPTTTAPEQLLLTWGSDPATAVTVSWLPSAECPGGRSNQNGHRRVSCRTAGCGSVWYLPMHTGAAPRVGPPAP